ncbi:MAG: L,D-transpeptidase family protein [Telluria sp.]
MLRPVFLSLLASLPATALAAPARPNPILETQVLLDRAHFSVGEIDGIQGKNMRMAIAGFQRKQGLEPSGQLTPETKAALHHDTQEPLTTYQITDADVAGPFQPVPEEMMAKSALPSLGYTTPLEGLAEKFHMSPGLLKKLNPGKDFGQAGAEITVANVLDTEPLPKAGRVVVDKSDSTVAVFDTQGQLVAQFPASTGSEHDPLPIGTWKVTGISQNPVFWYNPKLFWDADPSDQKTRIAPGPNNPVGVAWVQLSKPHYGIHGTPEPGSIGRTQSHGCIRLTNWDIGTLVKAVANGTEVILQD